LPLRDFLAFFDGHWTLLLYTKRKYVPAAHVPWTMGGRAWTSKCTLLSSQSQNLSIMSSQMRRLMSKHAATLTSSCMASQNSCVACLGSNIKGKATCILWRSIRS